MNFFVSFFHFLGSVWFAILLIATTALFVVTGTFIESRTESHQYAAYFTYSNSIFTALLWGFFINILISALRRWPFQRRHIPFLITHWGLLMILGGTMYKNYYGTQGNMSIIEGSASQEIFQPGTYALHVEKRLPNDSIQRIHRNYPISSTRKEFNVDPLFDELSVTIASYAPHTREIWETWIKSDRAIIEGTPAFPIQNWNDHIFSEPSTQITLQDQLWNVYAAQTPQIEEAIKKTFVEGLEVILSNTKTGERIVNSPLSEALSHNLIFPEGSATFFLNLDFSPEKGFQKSTLNVFLNNIKQITIPLNGPTSLLNQSAIQYLGDAPVTIELYRKNPILVMLRDAEDNLFLLAYDCHGRVHSEPFQQSQINSIIVYDQGFAGYSVQAKLPFGNERLSNHVQRQLLLDSITNQLREGLNTQELSPPLRLLKQACECGNADFATSCIAFLDHWNRNEGWLLSEYQALPPELIAVMENLNWQALPSTDREGCHWLDLLFIELDSELQFGRDPLNLLEEKRWPLLSSLQKLKNDRSTPCTAEESNAILTTLSQQVFASSSRFFPVDTTSPEFTPAKKARLLSAYFRAYGIHMYTILTPERIAQTVQPAIKYLTLECPLTTSHRKAPPLNKLEENTPTITLRVQKRNAVDWITLAYDRFGQGLKWPILNGEYLMRFQPMFHEIPYRIRLRQARQISYPNSTQPYSFESDLVITDARTQESTDKTISMNNVHETPEGYRFYLANIAPPDEGLVKRVQLVVNYDPAKYWLTYPGALILTLGIILLLWRRKT